MKQNVACLYIFTKMGEVLSLPLILASHSPFFHKGAKSGFDMCFDIGSQRLGPNQKRVSNPDSVIKKC